MLIFHEGLPGSGKSYEAAINQIIPALKKGRKVFAYIEGLNHEMFASVTELPFEQVKGAIKKTPIDSESYSLLTDEQKTKVVKSPEGWFIPEFVGLLHQIKKDQVKTIYNHVANDSLVIIDELQDFFPASMKKLDDGITSFVTQHRHRGLDIIAMGQDHRDCHNLWKRRIDQLYHFVKRDAIGQPTKYTWKSYKLNEGKLIKLRSGSGEYDKKYFGLYASHTSDTTNTDTHFDDRANVLKGGLFRYGLPAVFLVAVFAIYYLFGIFTGDVSIAKTAEKPVLQPAVSSPPPLPSRPVQSHEQPKPLLTYSQAAYIEEVITESKPRLGAIIEGKDKQGRPVVTALIQFMDKSHHAVEQFTLDQLQAFGWIYKRMPYGIKLVKGDKDIAVTSWPIEYYGRPSGTKDTD